VTAFAHHKEEKSQPTAGSQHEEASVNEKLAYEQFKLQWMIDHGFTLTDLIECLEIMIREDALDGGNRKDLQTLFEAWEFGFGFSGGQIWPCFKEFCDHEAPYAKNGNGGKMNEGISQRKDACTD